MMQIRILTQKDDSMWGLQTLGLSRDSHFMTHVVIAQKRNVMRSTDGSHHTRVEV
jgi:hypothetical protein